MKYSDNALNILTAKTFKGIGRAWIMKNLSVKKSVGEIIALLNDASKETEVTHEDFERKKSLIKKTLKDSESFLDGLTAIGDDDFPPVRGSVKNSEQPVFLFYRGNLNLLSATNKNIAVIGLLNPDENIEKIERMVVAELVKNGATIVSGLALGCDTIAHKQALDSKGRTVAILPSPLKNIMPATNRDLATEIVQAGGLLITEYLTDAKSKQELGGRYQERDRLQALYSDSIVLSASYAKNNLGNDSGSRLAMEYAYNYSIPRAVIYNKVEESLNPKYDLNRQLIKVQSDIIQIHSGNLAESVKKISNQKPKVTDRITHQQSRLF